MPCCVEKSFMSGRAEMEALPSLSGIMRRRARRDRHAERRHAAEIETLHRTWYHPRMKPRLIVGISGASGIAYGIRLLEALRELDFETHLVITRSARLALAYETSRKPAEIEALATFHHRNEDVAAPISSGSFSTLGMVVAPCSIRSLSEIATGVTSGLL